MVQNHANPMTERPRNEEEFQGPAALQHWSPALIRMARVVLY